jgi:E3 SUMO-protein ligase PIAS1
MEHKFNCEESTVTPPECKLGGTITSSQVFGAFNPSEEIEGLDYILSLRCPLSIDTIKVPARGEKCKHPQCFDLETFLSFGDQSTCWQCPICSSPLAWCDLLIDLGFEKALKGASEHVEEFRLTNDGLFVPLEPKKRKRETSDSCSDGEEDSMDSRSRKRSNSMTVLLDDSSSAPAPIVGLVPPNGSRNDPICLD